VIEVTSPDPEMLIVRVDPLPEVVIPVPPKTFKLLATGTAIPELVVKLIGTEGLFVIDNIPD
jgi:hypothetical protein